MSEPTDGQRQFLRVWAEEAGTPFRGLPGSAGFRGPGPRRDRLGLNPGRGRAPSRLAPARP